MNWYLKVVRDNYANFKGRARRTEYWMFILFNVIFEAIAFALDLLLGTYVVIFVIYVLAMIIPSLAVTVRRLHDSGKSGAWFFISFVPIIGGIWLLILLLTDSTLGDNMYGSSPKAQPVAAQI